MSENLLSIRMDVLLRSTKEVGSVVEALEASRKAVKDTEGALGSALLKANRLRTDFGPLVEALADLKADLSDNQATVEALDQAVGILELLTKEIPDLVGTLKRARADLHQLVSRYVPFGETLCNHINTKTSELEGKIENLQRDIGGADQPLPDLWRTYAEEVAPEARQLFAQYFDLLEGVSIRERGLAISALEEVHYLDELCSMADWHLANDLSRCAGGSEPTLILPGRDRSSYAPSWPIMRLGFAYWSIWGLPLEGHDFGLSVIASLTADTAGEWAEETTAFGADGLRLLIADTIGAWAEGPAYACALCFLGLHDGGNVGELGPGYVTPADRAYVVRAALRSQIAQGSRPGQARLTPEEVDRGYGYLEFVEGIASYWREAVGASGTPSPDRGALLDSLPARVWQEFRLRRPFKVEDWRVAKDAWSTLEQDQALADDPPVDIRHLMNAAWYARCSASASQQRPEEIERRTLRAGREIVQPRGPKRPDRPERYEQDAAEQLKRRPT